jgi:hypothetical protein
VSREFLRRVRAADFRLHHKSVVASASTLHGHRAKRNSHGKFTDR